MNEPRPLLHPAGEGSLPAPAPSPPANPLAGHPRLEAYLDRVSAPLARSLPEERRAELRAELRLHLEALVEAHCELGSDLETAVTEALAQFGDARQLARAWRHALPAPLHPVPATLVGGVFLTSICFGALGLCTAAETWLAAPVLPIFAGFLIGLADRKQPLAGWRGMLLIGLLSISLAGFPPGPPLLPWLSFAGIQLLMWLVTACGAAGLGTLLSRWRGQRQGAGAPVRI